jgi:hypothetical protein
MKGKILGWIVLLAFVLLPVALFTCGVAFADDGAAAADDGIDWSILGPILVALWMIYWPALLADWTDTWKRTKLSTLKKIGYSISALAGCLIPCLKTIWTQYGAVIVAFVKTLLRVKFGLPVLAQRAGLTRRL